MPAIVLTSGGLDSTTCLAIARHDNFRPLYTLSFDYGQRHRHELDAAVRIAQAFNVAQHKVIPIDLRQFGHSALTDDIAVPKDRDESAMTRDIPVTYVPARNTIFLSYALAWAEVLSVRDVFIGVNAVDYSGYPDCRPEFIAAFEAMANLATKMTVEAGKSSELRGQSLGVGERSEFRPEGPGQAGHGRAIPLNSKLQPLNSPFKIHAPLMHLTKAQIIRRGTELGVDYSMTHSCYDPDSEGRACGRCDSCVLRRKGFAQAGVPDPTTYA
jgi:7-cyano-7-deazaguanine synthase